MDQYNPYDSLELMEEEPPLARPPVRKKKKRSKVRRFFRALKRYLAELPAQTLVIIGGSVIVVLIAVILLVVLLPGLKNRKTDEPDQLTISDAATPTPTLAPVLTNPTVTPPQETPQSVPVLDVKLDLNMTHDLVPDIQTRLIELGYMQMPADGQVTNKYGPATKIAMRIFQYKNDLERDGVCGPLSYELLMSKALPADGGPKAFFLSRNDNDKDNLYDQGYVARLQTALAQLGYYTETVTGHFGNSTTTAVQKFQQDNGLEADGKAGQQTLALLYSGTALDAASAAAANAARAAAAAAGAGTSPAGSTSPDTSSAASPTIP